MKRSLVFALVGALSVAGGTGLAFGQQARPQSHATPQATKPHPPAAPDNDKRPPSKPATQVKPSAPQAHRPTAQASKSATPAKKSATPAKKSATPAKKSATPAHRPPAVASKSPHQPQKGQAKPGNGSPRGAGSYSWDDYKRDLNKAAKEESDANKKASQADQAVVSDTVGGAVSGAVGGAITGAPAGGVGALPGAAIGAGTGALGGAAGGVVTNAPQLIQQASQDLKADWDAATATGKFIGARLNDLSKPNPRPTNPRSGTGR